MALSTIPFSGLSSDASNQGVNFRNLIINGDMSIAQRGTSSTGITSDGYYTLDRFILINRTFGTWTQSQSTDVPTGQGFSKSLKMDCTTAQASPGADKRFSINIRTEGQNVQHLKYGTSNAESLTLSFWVKSNKTGTYIAELMNNDASYKHINKSYTISSADTWEKKTLTFAGDTASGFDNDTNSSFVCAFWLGTGTNYSSGTLQTSWGSLNQANRAVGQVNLADSTSNYINITGVQLEVGTSASDFEFLPYDVNLQRCQRYYTQVATLSGLNGHSFFYGYNTNEAPGCVMFPTTMRTTPTVTTFDNAGNSGAIHKFGAPDISGVTVSRASTTGYGTINTSGSFVAGGIYIGTWKADAEL